MVHHQATHNQCVCVRMCVGVRVLWVCGKGLHEMKKEKAKIVGKKKLIPEMRDFVKVLLLQ